MTRQRNLVDMITRDLWTIGKLDVLDDLYRTEYVDHSPVPGFPEGPEGLKRLVATAHRELVDPVMTVEQFVANGDWIAYRWRFRAHDTNAFLDDPLHGGEWDVHGHDMIRLRGDRIAEHWSEHDAGGLYERLATG